MYILELVLNSGLSYDEYMSQPQWFIEAHAIRFLAEKQALSSKK